MAASKTEEKEPSVPVYHLIPSIREPLRQALLAQLREKGEESTYEFQGMEFKLNKKKTRFILKYREDPCIVCSRDGDEIEHELGFKVFSCGHYNTCVSCAEVKLYRCPSCRFAFNCWWCRTDTGPDNQPAPRDNFSDQWGPLIWNTMSGICGICNQEVSADIYVNRLLTYVNIDRMLE